MEISGEHEEERKFGWIPDYPDFRDYTPETTEVAPLLTRAKVAAVSRLLGQSNLVSDATTFDGAAPQTLPPAVDLRPWFSPVDDQKDLGSCTAHAADSLVEYFERRAFNTYIDISRRFVYKVTREFLGLTGDTGATIRATMGALVLFGAPPEKYWLYDIPHFDDEPPAFCYAFGQNYKAVKYYRLDPPGTTPSALLDRIKSFVANGLPAMFGFSVYSSYMQASTTGKIPFPMPGDRQVGGHAIAVAGYDDSITIKHSAPGAPTTTGALLFKNSWGISWGDKGYGWLPYEYVLKGLAVDWWSLIQLSWVESGQFGLVNLGQLGLANVAPFAVAGAR